MESSDLQTWIESVYGEIPEDVLESAEAVTRLREMLLAVEGQDMLDYTLYTGSL